MSDRSVQPLIERLKIERSISSRKAIITALASLLRQGMYAELIDGILKKIALDDKEDYRVREEARMGNVYHAGMNPKK